MKTINKDIDIFNTLQAAQQAFNKIEHGHLLHSPAYKSYFVDKSKQAIKEWPAQYTLLKEK